MVKFPLVITGNTSVSHSGRAWIAFVAAAVVTIATIMTMPRYNVSPKGIVLPLNGHHAAFLGRVSVFDRATLPLDVKTIGAISLLYHSERDTPAAQQAVMQAARQMAAVAGGDGLMIFQMGHTYPGTPSAMAVMVLRGSVVKTHGFQP